ncbi:MAG: ABC transporter substrate binding protein, partial [Alphaproteobacteria bacterium]
LVADREELKKAMADNGDRFDGFVLGNQSAALDNADAAAELAGQKPVFSLAEKPIYNGAVGGVLSDDIKLGRWLADAVVAVVVNGKQIKDIPIRIDDEPTLYINMTAARRAGLDIPISILSVAKVIE